VLFGRYRVAVIAATEAVVGNDGGVAYHEIAKVLGALLNHFNEDTHQMISGWFTATISLVCGRAMILR
jgi:hypothetical protein